MEQKKKTPKGKGCLKAILIALGVLMIFGTILKIVDPDTNEQKTTRENYADLTPTVQVFADKILVRQLKYPDGWEYEYDKLIRDDSTKYTFQAIVLAQNGFGVRSRISYLLQMEFVGSRDQSYNYQETAKASNWNIIRNDLED